MPYRLKLCWLAGWLCFLSNYRLCGHWEMLLAILLDAVILCLVMGLWFLCWLSWTSMPSFQCWEMPRGLYQTFVEASHNLHLSRLVMVVEIFSCLQYLIQKIGLPWDLVGLFLHYWWQFIFQVRPALSALQRLVHSNDEEVLTDACWALSYLSDGTNDKIQAVIEAGVCPRLVELLMWVGSFSFLIQCTFFCI